MQERHGRARRSKPGHTGMRFIYILIVLLAVYGVSFLSESMVTHNAGRPLNDEGHSPRWKFYLRSCLSDFFRSSGAIGYTVEYFSVLSSTLSSSNISTAHSP
jgi:hypothetical protein